ncbi:MAG: cytochrome c-type biogenesis protein CcmH [Anaerolineales bacterium]
MRRLSLLIGLLVLWGAFALPAAAQEDGPTPSPDEVNAIAKNLYCPVCANVPLDACGTPACVQWRQQIAQMLSEGFSEQQIYDYFAQFGPSVLAAPPPSGFNWLIYLLPPLALLSGGFFLWRGLVAWKLPAAPHSEAKPRKTKFSQMIEDELKARRS